MHWVNLGLPPGWLYTSTGSPDDLNRLGGFLGAMAQSPSDLGPRPRAVRAPTCAPPSISAGGWRDHGALRSRQPGASAGDSDPDMTRPAEPTCSDLDHPIVQGPFGGGLSSVALAAAVSNARRARLVRRAQRATRRRSPPWSRPARGHRTAAVRRQPVGAAAGRGRDRPSRAGTRPHIERLRPYFDELGLPPPEQPLSFPDFAAQVDALLAAAATGDQLRHGHPAGRVLERRAPAGIRTIGTATTVDEAVAIEAAGLDAVVASGSDAGGHRGAFLRPVEESLVGTFSLVPQVADAVVDPGDRRRRHRRRARRRRGADARRGRGADRHRLPGHRGVGRERVAPGGAGLPRAPGSPC